MTLSAFRHRFAIFRAVGCDPLVSEVERLNADGQDIRNVAARVKNGSPPLPPSVPKDTEFKTGTLSAFALKQKATVTFTAGLN